MLAAQWGCPKLELNANASMAKNAHTDNANMLMFIRYNIYTIHPLNLSRSTDWHICLSLTNLWSCLPARCTRALSSGRWEEGRAAGGDPPLPCAGASPLWPTCAGDTPTHRGRLWPGQSPRGDGQCLFCLCWSPNEYGILWRGKEIFRALRKSWGLGKICTVEIERKQDMEDSWDILLIGWVWQQGWHINFYQHLLRFRCTVNRQR